VYQYTGTLIYLAHICNNTRPLNGDRRRTNRCSSDFRQSLLGAFAKFRKKKDLVSSCLTVCPSVYPHGTIRLSLGGVLLNLILEYFSKICLENSSLIKIS
jgi:hypothetical protein